MEGKMKDYKNELQEFIKKLYQLYDLNHTDDRFKHFKEDVDSFLVNMINNLKDNLLDVEYQKIKKLNFCEVRMFFKNEKRPTKKDITKYRFDLKSLENSLKRILEHINKLDLENNYAKNVGFLKKEDKQ